MQERPLTRRQLMKVALIFQGGLLFAGVLWGQWLDLQWSELCRFDGPAVLNGLIATLPLTLFLWLSLYVPWKPFREIKDLMLRTLGPMLAQCTWFDLLLLSCLAGISEEVMFRGAMQHVLARWGFWAMVIGTNVAFGLCHAFSAMYFFLAAAAGFYLSYVAGVDSQNLVPAMVAHSVYDFFALLVIRRRAMTKTDSPIPPAEPDSEDSADGGIPDATDENSAPWAPPRDKLG